MGAGPLPAQPPRPRRSRFSLAAIGLLAVAIGVSAVLLAPAIGLTWLSGSHKSCVLGSMVATERLWTPASIVEAPFGGTANATLLTYDSGGVGARSTIHASNGQASGDFRLDLWQILSASTRVLPGSGTNVPCSGAYVAVDTTISPSSPTLPGAQEWILSLLGPGNTSDRNVPLAVNLTAVNGTTYPSTTFDFRYPPGGIPPSRLRVSNCPNGGGGGFDTTSQTLVVGVPTVIGGSPMTLLASLDRPTTYHYVIGAQPGTWSYVDLSQLPGNTGAGLAFDYSPC